MLVAGDAQVIPAGHGLEIPPGIRHQMTNQGDTDLEFLVISSPRSDGDRS